MPDDNDDLAKVAIDFPRLDPDSPARCPRSMDDIQAYLALEDADLDAVEKRELRFLRTALVEQTRYWIWDYREADGALCYVTVAESPDGTNCLGMDGNWHGLTPEQFILGDYHQVF
jgi:hypothetical protein